MVLFFLPDKKSRGIKQFIAKPSKNNSRPVTISLNGAYISAPNLNDTAVLYGVWFLYSNGVSQSYYCQINKSIKEITPKLIIAAITNSIGEERKYSKNLKTAGGFIINNNKIKLQEYQIGHYGFYNLTEYNGIILNNQTINIRYIKFGKSNEDFGLNKDHLWYFLPMSKHDSSNQLMNKKWYWQK